LCLSAQIKARSSGISLEEFDSILATDVYEELGLVSSYALETENISLIWNSASAFEWKIAKTLSQTPTKLLKTKYLANEKKERDYLLFPYLVCEFNSEKHGYEVREGVEFVFGVDITVIYNSKQKTCFIVHAPVLVAESAPSFMAVHPLIPEMKIGKGTMQKIKDKKPSEFDVMLCPGVASSNIESETIGKSLIESMIENEHIEAISRLLKHDHDLSEEAFLSKRRPWMSALKEELHSDNECYHMFINSSISGGYKGESFVFSLLEDGREIGNTSSLNEMCLNWLVALLATSQKVCHIGVHSEMKLMNHEAQWITQSNVVDKRSFFDVGLDGTGQVISLSDTGLDMDSCYFNDVTGNVKANGSVDTSRRKVIQYVPYGNRGDSKFEKFHGTHVAGTLAGRKSSTATSIGDGIAREAKISFFDIGTVWGIRIPADVESMLNPGLFAGARIHSASWGTDGNGGSYDTYCRQFDLYTYNNPDFLSIFAAGNDGLSGPSSVTSPGSAKNVITVGASESEGRDLENMMKGCDYLADFSSRGPSVDGRTLPDLVAPGAYILSATGTTFLTGNCGLESKKGTSMAAPVVSGSAGLVRQYFEDGWYPTGKPVLANAMLPSAALVKAVLMNGAQFLKGVDADGHVETLRRYDSNQNFGRINLENSLHIDQRNNAKIFVVDDKISGKEIYQKVIYPSISAECGISMISATLVWSDPPAYLDCKKCLINDLDLYLTKNNEEQHIFPNGLDEADSINNAERVQVDAMHGDTYIVHVEGAQLISDQPFSLVITGCFSD